METTTIKVEYEYEFIFDADSEDCKQALKDYNDCIDKGASFDDMLKHIAFYINRFGVDSLIEGVGYVWVEGKEKPKEMWCGIIVKDGEPEPDVYFY